MNSSSKALGDEADDTRKELEDVEKNDSAVAARRSGEGGVDSRRVLEAQVQKLESQLSSSEGAFIARKRHGGAAVARLGAGRWRAPSKRLINIDWRPALSGGGRGPGAGPTGAERRGGAQ